MIKTYTSTNQVNILTNSDISVDLKLNSQFKTLQELQLKEVCLFIIGEFREKILTMTTENQAFIDNLLFNELISNNVHILNKMRILWLLEKISDQQQFFRENKEQKLRAIFENIVDFLVSSRNENGQVII